MNIFIEIKFTTRCAFLIKCITAVRNGDYIVSYASALGVASLHAFQNSNCVREFRDACIHKLRGINNFLSVSYGNVKELCYRQLGKNVEIF